MLIDGRHVHWTEALATVAEIDAFLAKLGHVRKADPNPLTPKGFDQWVDRFSSKVVKATSAADRKAINATVKRLDRKWAKLSEAKRARLIDDAMSQIVLKSADQVKVARVIGEEMKHLIATTKGASKIKGVDPVLDALDGRIVEHVEDSSAHFIRDAYGRRREALSKQARAIVSRGVEAGYDSATIGETLGNAMSTAGVLRARSYWNVVSSIYAARSRSWGLARSYDEGGIEYAIINSVLDELTTEQCNFLHEKRIPVGKVLDRFQEVADAPDPESVTELQPFLNLGKNDKGQSIIYYREGRDGPRKTVAIVDKGASGSRDVRGKYNQKMSDKEIVDAGIGFPPYHGFCRTTTVPDI